MCNFGISNFHVLHASNICCAEGKNIDNMHQVRYQHHNCGRICESIISRPGDPADVLMDSP